jgi:hypothetical protein
MDGTPRPTISVDNLSVNKRRWPVHRIGQDYDRGRRFCFRPGKLEYKIWQWPWPEWIGVPNTRYPLDEWLSVIDDWKITNKGTFNEDHLEKCIRCMLPYL